MAIPFWLSNIEKEQAQMLVNIGFQLSEDMSEENLFDDQIHVGSWKICKSKFRNISAFGDYPMTINGTVQAYCNGVIYEVYADEEADEFDNATEIIDELSIAYSQAIACIKANMSKQSENQLILLEI
jgi:hypothetical protein